MEAGRGQEMSEKQFRFQDLEIWQRGAAVSGKLLRLADDLEQRRLTCIRIANQGYYRRTRIFTSFTVKLAMGAHMLQLFRKLIFLSAQQTPVYFNLLFAFTPLLHASFLARQVRPLACETW